MFPEIAVSTVSWEDMLILRNEFSEEDFSHRKEALKMRLNYYYDYPDWNPLKEIRFNTLHESSDIELLAVTLIKNTE